MKKGYKENIEAHTLANTDFRRVLYTGSRMQLVLMSLQKGEDIGMEVHPDNDQFFRFESGQGTAVVNDASYTLEDGDVLIVPAGAAHNITNIGEESLKFYTIYSPAHHQDGIVRHTKEAALSQEAEFDGITTE